MNIYDVAEKSGVSIATVSRVINNKGNVSRKTRDKIMSVIRENNYEKSPSRYPKSTHTVGILCSNLSNPIIAGNVELLCKNLQRSNYKTLIYCCDNDIQDKKHSIEIFTENKIDALIIEGTNLLEFNPEDNQYLNEAASNCPVMVINSYVENTNLYTTICDIENSVFQLTSGYIKAGKTNILFIFSAMSSNCRMILKGFENAHFVHNIEISPDYAHLCKDTAAAYEYTGLLINNQRVPDAIIASDDFLAAGAIKVLLDNGYNIPDDVEIIGCGNTVHSTAMRPSISTIDYRKNEVCSTAVKSIIDIINMKEVPSITVIPAEFIKKETTL